MYLQGAHAAFTDPDGICKILCAMSGESVVSCTILIHSTHNNLFCTRVSTSQMLRLSAMQGCQVVLLIYYNEEGM